MSNAELARQLGVDKAIVSRDKRRGMPVHSLQAASAWRDAHLELARRKDCNPARADAGRRRGAGSAADELARVRRIAGVAQAALDVGLFAQAAPELRQALAAVPLAARPSVSLPLALWDALCSHVWPRVPGQPELADLPAEAVRPPRVMTGRDRTVYAIAAGEPVDDAWLDYWD